MKAISRQAGRRFAALVLGAIALEAAGAVLAWQGLSAIGQCNWVGFPFSNPGQSRPAACMEPVWGLGYHQFVPAVFLTIVVLVSIALGLQRAVTLLLGTRALRRRLRLGDEIPNKLKAAFAVAAASNVSVVVDDRCFAICIGYIAPRIAVSSTMIDLLSPEELAAVVAHEERHRRRRTPARELVARSLSRGLFFVPVLDSLVDIHRTDEEIVADAESTAVSGRSALASALQKVVVFGADREAAVGVAGRGELRQRIASLTSGALPPITISRQRAAASAAALLILTGLVVWMPVAGHGHPSVQPAPARPIPASAVDGTEPGGR